MNQFVRLLYKSCIFRKLVSYAVSWLGLKKATHQKFMNDVRECYPICTYHLSLKKAEWFYRDYLDAMMKFGISEVDYFTYEFYRLSDYGRSKFISERDRGELHRMANDREHWGCFADKNAFNSKYNEFINREYIYVQNESQHSDFLRFCNGKSEIIAKPVDGQKGLGIRKLDVSDDSKIALVWEECLKNHLLAEEVISQDARISCFHEQSINTVRIATAIDKEGVPHIMASVLRVGAGGSITDNASAGGLFAGVDVESGVIISKGLDLKAKPYMHHPDSGILFLGYQLPEWDELKALACKAALVTPEMRYVGWDWVLTKNGRWELLEGNEPGGAHIIQQGENRGMLDDYRKILGWVA